MSADSDGTPPGDSSLDKQSVLAQLREHITVAVSGALTLSGIASFDGGLVLSGMENGIEATGGMHISPDGASSLTAYGRYVRATGAVTVKHNSTHTTHTILQSDFTSVGFFTGFVTVGNGLQLDGTGLWVTDFSNVTRYLGFILYIILYIAEQCYSMMIKKRRQGPSFVGEMSAPAWWSKKLSDKHRCWEALVERGPTETIQFHDRLIVLYMIVVIHLLPLLLALHRSDASGVRIVVSTCFHLVLLAAVVATGANGLMIDKFLQGELRQYEAQAWALGASEAHIEAVRRSNVPGQSVIELLHYLTRTYGQLRHAARRLGAEEGQIESALTMDANSKKAAIILFLLQLREQSIDSSTEATKNGANGKVVNNGGLKSDEVWMSCAGKPVISGCNLTDFGIQQGSTVTMIRRLCGGMPVVSDGSALEPKPEPEQEPEPESAFEPESVFGVIASPVDRSISLRWLIDFVAQNRGKRISFERREFLAPEDDGGNEAGIGVTAETLSSHRIKRRASEAAGTGQPVMVRYSGIVFEAMTTADVMEAMIRPVARTHHKSFAEAKI
eukprot:SAG22_NODE_1036_length_5904_cov_4.908355_1_plen_556_part_10